MSQSRREAEFLVQELLRPEYYDRFGYLNSEGRTLLERLIRLLRAAGLYSRLFREVRRMPSRERVEKLVLWVDENLGQRRRADNW